jgi:hypothetical protein
MSSVDDQSMAVLDAAIADAKKDTSLGGAARLFFMFVATVMMVPPLYLYVTPLFELSFVENWMYPVISGVVCVVLLSLAYNKKAAALRMDLLQSRGKDLDRPTHKKTHTPKDKSGPTKSEKRKEREMRSMAMKRSTQVESCAFAIFCVNALFLCLFGICAFFLVPKIPMMTAPEINCAASLVAPALVCFMYAREWKL